MFEFIETKRHTVESVYGRPESTVLKEVDALKHEATEFRMPTTGEVFYPIGTPPVAVLTATLPWGPFSMEPRLILRRKTVKRRVLTETGEVKLAVRGEWYATSSGQIMQAGFNHEICYSPIYRETFVEVEA